MRFADFLTESRSNRRGFQNKGYSQNLISQTQIRDFVRMPDFFDAFVNGVSCTDSENKNGGGKRLEKALLAITERMFFRRGTLVETQSQKQENLISCICQKMQSFRHHPGRAGKDGGDEFQNRD